mgnify:CR=1 FL=1
MRRSLRLVAPDVTPHRALILAGVVALLMEVAFRVLEPWPMKVVVDAVTAYRGAKVSHQPASFELLLWCGIALLLIVGLRAVSNYLATICFALVGSRAATSLRARVFRHVQGLSQQFHARNRSADTVQRIVGDVARMQEVAITAGLPLLANVLTLFVMVIVMYVLDALLASVVLVAILVFAFTSAPTSKKITSASRQTRKGEGQLANTAQESLASINVVQAYGLEDMVAQNFTSANRTSLREGVRSRRYAARLERTTDVIVGLATAVVLVGGGLRVMQGAMSPGDLVLFTTYLRTTMKPLRDMAKYTGRIARASASGDRVADLMEIAPDVVAPETPLRPTAVWGAVQFDRVVTQYDGVEVLRGLSLDIRPGERVAIIGPSGAGKSTLVSLLVRAIDPVSGCVRLDGYRLTDLDLAQLRSSVSLLHQEAVLFTGTIRENIRMGRSDATDAEVEAAARAANAHDFITEQPEGYDTVVGERGGTLSGGQRQMVMFAQVLLRDPEILLLDEPVSALDMHHQCVLLEAVRHHTRERGLITLMILHDLNLAAQFADEIILLADAKIQAQGTPRDVLEKETIERIYRVEAAVYYDDNQQPAVVMPRRAIRD